MGLLKKYNKYLADATEPLFASSAAEDFSPDIVRVFGMDCFEGGLKTGLWYGTVGVAMTFGTLYVLCYRATHKKDDK